MTVIDSFADMRDNFLAAVRGAVWCNFATIGTLFRPFSRVIHPIWEG